MFFVIFCKHHRDYADVNLRRQRVFWPGFQPLRPFVLSFVVIVSNLRRRLKDSWPSPLHRLAGGPPSPDGGGLDAAEVFMSKIPALERPMQRRLQIPLSRPHDAIHERL